MPQRVPNVTFFVFFFVDEALDDQVVGRGVVDEMALLRCCSPSDDSEAGGILDVPPSIRTEIEELDN